MTKFPPRRLFQTCNLGVRRLIRAAVLISKQLKSKSREYRESSCERIKYWLTLTLLHKKYKRRDKSNLKVYPTYVKHC